MVDFRQYLNPIYKNLKDTLAFDNIKDADDAQLQEYPFLKDVAKYLGEEIFAELRQLEEAQEDLEKIIRTIETTTGDDKEDAIKDYNITFKKALRHVEILNKYFIQLDAPYFGKIDFDRQAANDIPARLISTRIGKFAYFDKKTGANLISDWRAPISNLYYMNSGPTQNVTFLSPVGEQKGNLKSKVQIDIMGTRIRNVYNTTTGNASADAFLLAQLQRKIGKKLTDIVATIQEQQNVIIREDINHPSIIQGVAGSGKTTILLHRIAYLLYTYPDKIYNSNFLIIAPNKMFLDYISDILPSLGVNEVNKNTYTLWAKTMLGFGDKYNMTNLEDDLDVKEFKGSSKFIELINRYFEDFEKDFFDKMQDKLKYAIKARYYELKGSFANMSLEERVYLSIEYAFSQLQFVRKQIGNFMGNLEAQEKRIKELKAYTRKRLDIYKLYKELFKFDYIFEVMNVDKKLEKKVRDYTLKYMVRPGANKEFKNEDLAPMMWLLVKIKDVRDDIKDYIAVDEAQDMSLFQIITLAAFAKNGNITLAGDLAQSIIPPFYIKDWDEVVSMMQKEMGYNTTYHQLDKCYRTTIEIIGYANNIFKKYFPDSYNLPEAVLRHGSDVTEIRVDDEINDSNIKYLLAVIQDEIDNGAVTTAVICRDINHADNMFRLLSKYRENINTTLSDYNENDFREGVLVLPVERAKGLEFDSVILADTDSKYDMSTTLDARLLYVAMTRALHRLYVFYNRTKIL